MEQKENLLRLRKEKGLSQAELAEELGITRQTISRWETGLASPSAENLIGLSQVYGMTVEEMMQICGMQPAADEPPAEPPAAEEGGEETESDQQTEDQVQDRPHKRRWRLELAVVFCGGVLLWGKLTNSMGAAKLLLELAGFILVSGWVLYNLHKAFSILKKEKDDHAT